MDRQDMIKNTIFMRLDSIERVTNKMAHEIDEIKDDLELWQTGNIKSNVFMEKLNKYWDSLNMDGMND